MLHRDLTPSPSRKKSPARSPAKIITPKDAKKLFSSMWNKLAVDTMKDEVCLKTINANFDQTPI